MSILADMFEAQFNFYCSVCLSEGFLIAFAMGRRLCTLIGEMFFYILNKIVILIKCTKINMQNFLNIYYTIICATFSSIFD